MSAPITSITQLCCRCCSCYKSLSEEDQSTCNRVGDAVIGVIGLLLLIFGAMAVAQHYAFVGLGSIAGGVLLSVGVITVVILSAIRAKAVYKSTGSSAP